VLVSDGGGAARNWLAESITNGLTAQDRLRVRGAVARAQGQDGGRRALPEGDAPRLLVAVGELGEILLDEGVEGGALRGPQSHQRVVGRLGDGHVEAGAPMRGGKAGVAAVAVTGDRVHGVEHRDVHDGQRAGAAVRAELLAEDPRVSRWGGGVVERGGGHRDLVPAQEPRARVVPDRLAGERKRRGFSETGIGVSAERVGRTLLGERGRGQADRKAKRGDEGLSVHGRSSPSRSRTGPSDLRLPVGGSGRG
jgi:hypothetical protein